MKFFESYIEYQMLNENVLYYKTIEQLLEYFDSLKNKNFIFLDTETTGLGGPQNDQLTQLSFIATESDGKIIHSFDAKIKLDDNSKKRLITDPLESPPGKNFSIHQVLKLNHYYDPDRTYIDEDEALEMFAINMDEYARNGAVMVIQNAAFDMKMISGRNKTRYNLSRLKIIDLMKLTGLYLVPILEKLQGTDDPLIKLAEQKLKKSKGKFSTSLSNIINLFTNDHGNTHDSLADCKNMITVLLGEIEIFKKYKHLDIMSLQDKKIQWYRKIGK